MLLAAAVLALSNSVVFQLMTQLVASILYTCSPFAPRNFPTHRSHVTECCSVIGWSAQQLPVRQVPRPLPSFAEVGVAMQDYAFLWTKQNIMESVAEVLRPVTSNVAAL